ncbi:MAG: type III PLP-dependent enzyme [Magnetococcales bacterium]|nr:type III PLP-dependent enzyme [Magnetococcales bacterium]
MDDKDLHGVLNTVAKQFGTPCYVYFQDTLNDRIKALKTALGDLFEVSYAVKSNPNRTLIRHLLDRVDTLDVSSSGELERAVEQGWSGDRLTFSGPAKRRFELVSAITNRCGEVVCESADELAELDQLAGEAGQVMTVLLRINPLTVPKQFGVRMAGKPSQFGIDEEQVDAVLDRFDVFSNLRLKGFHIYSGTNSLNAEGIAENIAIMGELFIRFSERHDLHPEKLIFGSGFGIPYHDNDVPLDLDDLAGRIRQAIQPVATHPRLKNAVRALEMGRYLIGPSGYFLTSVIRKKQSRGTDIALCDGGFNNHIAAFGMLGMVIRRNYPIFKVRGSIKPAEDTDMMLTGPLCTTIDILSQRITLPALSTGDVLGISSSGAYGLTASPEAFIGHPAAREILVTGMAEGKPVVTDISHSSSCG